MGDASTSNDMDSLARGTKDYLQAFLCVPFDLARENYATAVRFGVIEKSMLASAEFGRSLNQWETITLGLLARSR